MDLARKKLEAFLSVIPKWIRFGLVGVTVVAAMYWSFAHDVTVLGDQRLGFGVCWLALLVPCVAAIYATAWLLHRRRRRQDFPRAVARDVSSRRTP